ncbi:MAG: hypothetical protein ACOY42_01980 [Pseudomonadota bacterium]
MLSLDDNQRAILAERATNPVYLISTMWQDAAARWSTQGDRVVDGLAYQGGIAGVRGADNWRSADITIVPTATDTDWLLTGAWRGQPCTISLLPYRVRPGIVDDGYFEDGYGFFGTEEIGAPVLLLDGVMSAAEYSGSGPITITIRHQATVGRMAPRTKLLPPICNSLPAPGTKFTWASEVYILEAR